VSQTDPLDIKVAAESLQVAANDLHRHRERWEALSSHIVAGGVFHERRGERGTRAECPDEPAGGGLGLVAARGQRLRHEEHGTRVPGPGRQVEDAAMAYRCAAGHDRSRVRYAVVRR